MSELPQKHGNLAVNQVWDDQTAPAQTLSPPLFILCTACPRQKRHKTLLAPEGEKKIRAFLLNPVYQVHQNSKLVL